MTTNTKSATKQRNGKREDGAAVEVVMETLTRLIGKRKAGFCVWGRFRKGKPKLKFMFFKTFVFVGYIVECNTWVHGRKRIDVDQD